jgi:hypothetical protein
LLSRLHPDCRSLCVSALTAAHLMRCPIPPAP